MFSKNKNSKNREKKNIIWSQAEYTKVFFYFCAMKSPKKKYEKFSFALYETRNSYSVHRKKQKTNSSKKNRIKKYRTIFRASPTVRGCMKNF